MLERVIQKALRTPWAITPEYGAIVQDVLISRARGIRLSDADIEARIEAQTGHKAAARVDAKNDGVIAVIPVHGVIANRSFEASSGATSCEFVTACIDRVESDAGIKAILFDFSTPGGSVEGVPELGKRLRAIAKPTIAYVNALAASAGYWLASGCDEIVMRESAYVGSVGVFCLLEDWSEYLAKEGIKINAISAGDYKLEGAPWEPLSEEARAFLQADVDACYAKFLKAVADGRGVSVAVVKKQFGQGRCLGSTAALAAGMADKIGEFDVAITRANALAKAAVKPASVSGRLVSAIASRSTTMASACPDCGGSGLKPERFMSDPQGQEPCQSCQSSTTGLAPNADGSCPDGYEPHDDGMCYAIPETPPADDTGAAAIDPAVQAQSDRDAIEIARA